MDGTQGKSSDNIGLETKPERTVKNIHLSELHAEQVRRGMKRKEGRKEGGKEGRREGRKERRNYTRTPRKCVGRTTPRITLFLRVLFLAGLLFPSLLARCFPPRRLSRHTTHYRLPFRSDPPPPKKSSVEGGIRAGMTPLSFFMPSSMITDSAARAQARRRKRPRSPLPAKVGATHLFFSPNAKA
jgi:hypothetical protein